MLVYKTTKDTQTNPGGSLKQKIRFLQTRSPEFKNLKIPIRTPPPQKKKINK